MKRMILALAVVINLPALHAWAQGTVNFGNNNSTPVLVWPTLLRAGTTFQVSLYYMQDGPEPTPIEMDLLGIRIGANGSIAPAAGLFAAGTRTTPATTPGAGFAWFQVRAWETAFGTSYEAVRANPIVIGGRRGCTGTSNIIRVKTGDPANNIPPGALTAYGLQSFLVCEVPEPGSIALVALGLGTLLLVRPRKKPVFTPGTSRIFPTP